MKTDLYSKVMLTVIAACLIALVGQNVVSKRNVTDPLHAIIKDAVNSLLVTIKDVENSFPVTGDFGMRTSRRTGPLAVDVNIVGIGGRSPGQGSLDVNVETIGGLSFRPPLGQWTPAIPIEIKSPVVQNNFLQPGVAVQILNR